MANKKNKMICAYNGRVYASGLEVEVAKRLDDLGVAFTYESTSYSYRLKTPRAYCSDCGCTTCYVSRMYTPDFFIKDGAILEVKGKFGVKDRVKMEAVCRQYQELPFKMLFSQDNWINKHHITRYSGWCAKRKIDHHVGLDFTKEWLYER